MTDSAFSAGAATPAPALPANVAELAQRTPGVVSGARWFWWIAGLSLVNVACDIAHADISFVMGLAFTQLAHAMFHANLGIAFVVDAFFIGGFYLLGRQAQRGQMWAFLLGIVVYVCDALVYVKFESWMPVAFHALALFYIAKAVMNLQAAQKATGVR
jgi:hypothetical protein